MVIIARSAAEVDDVVRRILDSSRTRPIAVATTLFDSGQPLIDLDALEAAIDGVADVALIASGELTYRFAGALPPDCATFNGAVRSFPTDTEWQQRPTLARRRFSFFATEADEVLQNVIDDLLGMASRAGLTVASARTARPASGVVRGLIADDARAIVQLDSGSLATISAELTFAPAPLPWVIAVGSAVRGLLDPDTSRLALEPAIASAADLWAHYPDGAVTLALVHRVERQRATLLVHPEHPVAVTRGDLSTNPHDRVDLLLTEGDVIDVRVVRDAQGRLALQTIDLDDDEHVLPALALTPGGLPWLAHGRPLLEPEPDLTVTSIEQFLASVGLARAPEVDDHDAAPATATATATAAAGIAAPRPGPGPQPAERRAEQPVDRRTALQSALTTVDELKAQLRAARAERRGSTAAEATAEVERMKNLVTELLADNGRALNDARQLRDRLKDAQASLRSARRTSPDAAPEAARDRRTRFADADEWIRHELYLQWIERFDPATRAQHPLPAATLIGPQFAASLDPLDDAQLDRALRCTMEAVTGFIAKVSAREVHVLRSGDGASDPPRVRPDDGARCMRAYIEQKTPQARRLHYWALRGGGVELSRVVQHDDVEP